ncbi:MAG: acyltransferase [Aestuariivirga sp.]
MIWSLQILRFVAALMVVYIHAVQIARAATGANGLLPPEFQIAGQAGVDIFFVISGVIIARTAKGLAWQEFGWKRVRRIIPIYFIIGIFVILISLRNGSHVAWRELAATFLLWPATDVMTVPLLPVAWTLCFEALFYAAATLVIADRRWLLPILLIFGASLALRARGPVFQFLGNPLMFEFLLGIAVARAPAARQAIWLIPAGAIALVAAGFMGSAPTGSTLDNLMGEGGFQRVLVYGVPAALIVYGTMQIRGSESPWTRQGDASYSLYLTHPLLMPTLLALWKLVPLQADLVILITATASVIFGWRIHLAIEKPVIAWLSRQGWQSLGKQAFWP